MEHTLEERVEQLEKDVGELRLAISLLNAVINGDDLSFGMSTKMPPKPSENTYTRDEFVPNERPSGIDENSLRIMRRSRESKKKV